MTIPQFIKDLLSSDGDGTGLQEEAIFQDGGRYLAVSGSGASELLETIKAYINKPRCRIYFDPETDVISAEVRVDVDAESPQEIASAAVAEEAQSLLETIENAEKTLVQMRQAYALLTNGQLTDGGLCAAKDHKIFKVEPMEVTD